MSTKVKVKCLWNLELFQSRTMKKKKKKHVILLDPDRGRGPVLAPWFVIPTSKPILRLPGLNIRRTQRPTIPLLPSLQLKIMIHLVPQVHALQESHETRETVPVLALVLAFELDHEKDCDPGQEKDHGKKGYGKDQEHENDLDVVPFAIAFFGPEVGVP
jgi:hypothetical protein